MVFYGVRDGRICIISDGVSVKSVKGLCEGQTCGVIDQDLCVSGGDCVRSVSQYVFGVRPSAPIPPTTGCGLEGQ